MLLDATFIRFHRILSLRNTWPTADYTQLLFGTQYDGNKVKGKEKRLIKKVKGKVIPLQWPLGFW